MLRLGQKFVVKPAALCLAIGLSVGMIGGALSASIAAAVTPEVSCSTGIGISIGATIHEGATTTLAPSQSIARVGDTITYTVTVATTSGECSFNTGMVHIKTPDGVSHLLTSHLSLSPGSSATYASTTYTVNNSNVGTNTAPAGAIRAQATVKGVATETGGTLETVTAATNYNLSVIHPETTLVKKASVSSGPIPLKVTFTFQETNSSSDPTSNELAADVISTVHVTDATGCTPVFQTSSNGTTTHLAVGATWTYTCSKTFTDVGTFIDHAMATGVAGDKREAGTATSLGAPQNETAQATVTAVKATPGISTSPQPASATVGSTTLNDKVTLSGLVNPVTSGPGVGKITVKLYAPTHSTCIGTAAFTQVITATSGNGTYPTTGGPTADRDRGLALDGVLLR